MGGKVSKTENVPGPVPSIVHVQTVYEPAKPVGPPEFDEPWRKMPWGKKAELENKLRNFKLRNVKAPYVRILIVGEVGAGKSSFINSVNNAFQGRITSEALTATGSGKSFTTTYTTHYIDGEDGSPMPFVFNDIMGLESDEGVHTQDISTAVRGFLKEGHKFEAFKPVCPNDEDYRTNPSLEEQTFCLVNIIAADKISLMNQEVIKKMNFIRQVATSHQMPQVIVMTRADLACPLVSKDLRKIYTSKKIKAKMMECSNMLGIPLNYIFPVKNYHEEIDTEDDMDHLILKALEQIVNIAADTMKKKSSNSRGKQE